MSVEIVSWSIGTDEQIAAMLDAAAAGEIDLQRDGGWKVGDIRTIKTVGLLETGKVTNIDVAITSFDEYMNCGNLLQFDFITSPLADNMKYSDETADGGYGTSRQIHDLWLPYTEESFPAFLRHRLKSFDAQCTTDSSDLSVIGTVSYNKLALRSQREVFGTGPAEGEQLNYYQNESNRIKKTSGNENPCSWWLRTIYDENHFCIVTSTGDLDNRILSDYVRLVAFGCLGGYDGPELVDNLPIDEEHFPDSKFRSIVTKFDLNKDGFLSKFEIESITTLATENTNYSSVTTLKGIEYFRCITYLALYHLNSYASEDLDLSSLTLLKNATIDNARTCKRILLDGSNLQYLKIYYCKQVDSIVFELTPSNLEYLYLTALREGIVHDLDISGFTRLKQLMLVGNVYRSIDIRNIPRLLLAFEGEGAAQPPSITWNYGTKTSGSNTKGSIRAVKYSITYNRGQNPIPEDNQAKADYVLAYDPDSNIVTDQIEITEQPVDSYIPVNSDTDFHCEATAEDNISYQWEYRNYLTNMSSTMCIHDWTSIATGQDLVIKSLPIYDYYVFRCKAYLPSSLRNYYIEDQYGNGHYEQLCHIYNYTDIVHVHNQYPVSIVKQPIDALARPKDIVVFSVEASNAPPEIVQLNQTTYYPDRTQADILYQWQRSEKEDDNYSNIIGAKASDYRFVMADGDDNYKYRCVISDGTDELISDSATIILGTIDGIPIDAEHFPDAVFRQYISEKFDKDENGYLSDSEIADAIALDISINTVSGTGLTDLTGINYLTALKVLSISDTGNRSQLSQVNIDNLLDLEELTIRNSAISTVDISKNTKLKKVFLTYDPNLSSLDFSNNPDIETLGFGPGYTLNSNCNISQLDLSNLRKLKSLDIKGVKISECDLTNNPDLSLLIIYGPNIQNLKLNNCQKLHVLSCVNNPSLTKLDISGNPYLIDAYTNYSPSIISYDYVNRAYRYTTGVREDGTAGTLEIDLSTEVSTNAINIIKQPQNVIVQEDALYTFSIEAEGQNLAYQWQYRKDQNSSWIVDTSAITDTYESIATIEKNGYQYRCLISNQSLTVYSDIVTLTICSPPTITQHPQSISVTEGNNATFTINVSGSSINYQWQFSSDNGTTWNDIRNSNSSSFNAIATLPLNGYRYRCIVTNDLGTATSDAATLTVTPDTSIAKPTITSQPSSTTVAEGSNATFAVSANGSDISYQWQVFKNNQWQSITDATNSSYVMSATRGLNNSKYRCIVSNAAGAVYSDEAILTVSAGDYVSTPRILKQPKSVNADLGETVTFWVRAEGNGISYQWQKLNGSTWYDITGAIGSSYILIARTEIHNTQYRCVVTNAAGTVYSNSASLAIKAGQDLVFCGYHSIIISGKNTYGEWEMYPTSRPHVAPPEVKTSYVDLPGADGGLDYTDLLTGEPRYGYCKGTWEFMLIPQERWAAVYRSLVKFLHGRRHTVILEDDPNYVYTGRLSVNEWQSVQHNSLISIDYVLEPFPRNISGEEEAEQDAEALDAAFNLLNKEENAGKVIAKVHGDAMLIDPEMLFENGDIIAY